MNRHAIIEAITGAGVNVKNPVRVVGETPTQYKIEVDQPTGLPPGFTILMPGQQKLVPKSAILFDYDDEREP